jgi:hypothetical protein
MGHEGYQPELTNLSDGMTNDFARDHAGEFDQNVAASRQGYSPGRGHLAG